jgi:hypothetical protein
MLSKLINIPGAFAAIGLMLFLNSCSSYNRQLSVYYDNMAGSNYAKASAALDQNKLLKARRNRLLYVLEKGKLAHLQGQYDSSNRFFNEADLFMEDVNTSVKDIALGTLLNPMMQTYKGESFERFMVHYYKALNYFYLGQTEEALVEAKRISLRSYAQQDKSKNKSNRYSDDAFSLMLQGIIYEAAGDANNAFIAYRNASDIYINHDYSYYGTQMPVQLQKDLLRTARMNGFEDQVQRYEKLFNRVYDEEQKTDGGELIVFWENGMAPVKREQNFFFTLTEDGAGNFSFIDATGSFHIPFDFSTGVHRDSLKIADLQTFRVAFPRYEEQPVLYRSAAVQLNDRTYPFEAADNINEIAFSTLKERFVKEMSLALSRLAVKKLAELALKPKKDDKNKDEKEALSLALQLFSLASEKADTRNWQSLPHTIYYTRIPLAKGKNEITVNLSGASSKSITLSVEGTGKLQLKNIFTVR